MRVRYVKFRNGRILVRICASNLSCRGWGEERRKKEMKSTIAINKNKGYARKWG